MFSVIVGTILLAAVHALIPNHWLPLVAVARAEQWKPREVTRITLLAALAHVTGTVVLGLILGLIGKELVKKYGNTIFVASGGPKYLPAGIKRVCYNYTNRWSLGQRKIY